MRRKSKDQRRKVIELQAVGRPDSSRRGDASEAAFVARACGFDFRVAKPWGNRDPYDVLVGMGQEFWRVQVKCTSYYNGNAYWIKVGGRSGHYSKDEIDFLAAHVVPEDVWYIVPVEAFADVSGLHFNPQVNRKAKYEKYREAWCLLACNGKARGWKDIPVVCRCKDLPLRCTICPNHNALLSK